MSDATSAFVELLPIRIERAEIEGPTLLIGGVDWSLSATCDWRWMSADGSVVSEGTPGREDLIWNLVGEQIVEVSWSRQDALGRDPSFSLRSGGSLQVFSDATYDTWVLHSPTLVLVGPLRS